MTEMRDRRANIQTWLASQRFRELTFDEVAAELERARRIAVESYNADNFGLGAGGYSDRTS